MALAYGMGFNLARDCDGITTLSHAGGYPGYGSFVLLLPDYAIGIFAFANRTYAAPSGPVMEAALQLKKAGLLVPRPATVSAPLDLAYHAAGAAYRQGSLEPARGLLAMNFLMDRPAERWENDLSRLRARLGDCQVDAPLAPAGLLSGRFQWTCERGRLDGRLLLAPTNPPTIQSLQLSVAR